MVSLLGSFNNVVGHLPGNRVIVTDTFYAPDRRTGNAYHISGRTMSGVHKEKRISEPNPTHGQRCCLERTRTQTYIVLDSTKYSYRDAHRGRRVDKYASSHALLYTIYLLDFPRAQLIYGLAPHTSHEFIVHMAIVRERRCF